MLPLRRTAPDGRVQLVHVERHLTSETRQAIALAEALHLDWPGTAAIFDWRFLAQEEALDFVAEAQALAESGRIEILWDSKPVHVTRAARAERLQLKLGMRRDWLEVRGGFRLDGGELPLPELLQALREGKRFVALDEDRFVELGEDLRKQLAPLASNNLAFAGHDGGTRRILPDVRAGRAGVGVQRAAERAVQTAEERFKSGVTSLVEVTQARTRHILAASALVDARANLLLQRIILEYDLGTFSREKFAVE